MSVEHLSSTLAPAFTPALARFLEPHLPLIYSRTLNAFYTDLRYQQGTHEKYIPDLLHEAKTDYRLARLLVRTSDFIKQHNTMK